MADGVSFKFVDLFAGLGGFHVALSRLGGEAVFAAEWDAQLNALYETNFGMRPAGDITLVEPSSIPDHDVLTAGFPCQPFSKAGEQLGFDHTSQGQLFFSVERILREKLPGAFILENVPNILRHKRGETISLIRERLELLGYEVDLHRYSPHEFGVPQIRERVYIVGRLRSRGGLAGFNWPTTSQEPTTIESVLDQRPSDARPVSGTALAALEAWDSFLQLSKGVRLPSFPVWAMEFGATYSYENETPFALAEELGPRGLAFERASFGEPMYGMTVDEQFALLPSHARRPEYQFPKWKIDFIRQNREFYAENRAWIDDWLPSVRSLPSSFQKFEWNAQGEPRSIWNFVVQMRASGVRVKRRTTAPSLVAMTDTQVPIIGWERRYMTPRECARLQSLEGIRLPDRPGAAYKALGNAVNARVVKEICRTLVPRAEMRSHQLAS